VYTGAYGVTPNSNRYREVSQVTEAAHSYPEIVRAVLPSLGRPWHITFNSE
jgi:hypothetical protein